MDLDNETIDLVQPQIDHQDLHLLMLAHQTSPITTRLSAPTKHASLNNSPSDIVGAVKLDERVESVEVGEVQVCLRVIICSGIESIQDEGGSDTSQTKNLYVRYL